MVVDLLKIQNRSTNSQQHCLSLIDLNHKDSGRIQVSYTIFCNFRSLCFFWCYKMCDILLILLILLFCQGLLFLSHILSTLEELFSKRVLFFNYSFGQPVFATSLLIDGYSSRQTCLTFRLLVHRLSFKFPL